MLTPKSKTGLPNLVASNNDQAIAMSVALMKYGLNAYQRGFEDKTFDPKMVMAESIEAAYEILKALGYVHENQEAMKQCLGAQLLLALPAGTMH